MSNRLEIKLLERYRVDRATGGTADGSTQLVILVLKAKNAPELAAAISRADAMVIAHQLMSAASEGQQGS
jgi:hypothetical protein